MNILLAFNDTDVSNRALERAAQLAKLFEAKLVVASVTPVAIGVAPDMTPGPELRKADALLRAEGVEAELVEVTAEGARGSRTYAVTDAGRENLREWMFNRPKNRKVRNEDVLRMFLISALDHDDAVDYLRRVAGSLSKQITDLHELRATSGPVIQSGRGGFGLLAAEYGLRQIEAIHGWAEWAIEQLESAAA